MSFFKLYKLESRSRFIYQKTIYILFLFGFPLHPNIIVDDIQTLQFPICVYIFFTVLTGAHEIFRDQQLLQKLIKKLYDVRLCKYWQGRVLGQLSTSNHMTAYRFDYTCILDQENLKRI
jgi:hypothetical protein